MSIYKNKSQEEIELILKVFPDFYKDKFDQNLDFDDLKEQLKIMLRQKELDAYKSTFDHLSPITLKTMILNIDELKEIARKKDIQERFEAMEKKEAEAKKSQEISSQKRKLTKK